MIRVGPGGEFQVAGAEPPSEHQVAVGFRLHQVDRVETGHAADLAGKGRGDPGGPALGQFQGLQVNPDWQLGFSLRTHPAPHGLAEPRDHKQQRSGQEGEQQPRGQQDETQHGQSHHGVLPGQGQEGQDAQVLGKAEEAVRGGLRCGVGQEPQAHLPAVGAEGDGAPGEGGQHLEHWVQLSRRPQSQEGAPHWADEGVDAVPDGGDEGDLVRQELQQEQEGRGAQHQGVAEQGQIRGQPLDPAQALGQTHQEHREVEVDARDCGEPEDGGQGLDGAHQFENLRTTWRVPMK